MAARRRRTEGYLLADLCIGMFVICSLTAILLYRPEHTDRSYHLFPDSYLRLQSEAILNSERREMTAEDDSRSLIRFNRKGNVDQARTLHFSTPFSDREIVIELGGGRLVFRTP